jgi:hypothetical protein
VGGHRSEFDVVDQASRRGLRLFQRELDTGQLAWVWSSSGDGPQPACLTRRHALDDTHLVLSPDDHRLTIQP